MRQKTELETGESGSGSTLQAWSALVVTFAAIIGAGLAAQFVVEAAALVIGAVALLVVFGVTGYLSLGPKLRAKRTRELAAHRPPKRLMLPPAGGSARVGIARRIDSDVKSHYDNRRCLVTCAWAADSTDDTYVRARESADFLVESAKERMVVTGEVWMTPKDDWASRRIKPKRLAIPSTVRIGSKLLTAVIRDGDRVRVYGTPEIEAHRVFATYRDATGPVLRGRPGAPIIVERVD
jgi:hypothetical protein